MVAPERKRLDVNRMRHRPTASRLSRFAGSACLRLWRWLAAIGIVASLAAAERTTTVLASAGGDPALPHPGIVNVLQAVAATSTSDAWAVGWYCRRLCKALARPVRPLILHWNGRSWSRAKIGVEAAAQLAAVTASSSRDAWAVGNLTTSSGTVKTLSLHWNGFRWSQIPSPSPGGYAGSWLTGVSQASRTGSLWAIGYYNTPRGPRGLFMYWSRSRSRWIRVNSTAIRDRANLTSVATARGARPEAGGFNAQRDTTLAYQWTGRRWVKQAAPNPGGLGYNDTLASVAETSSKDAWAVGTYTPTSPTTATLILHWNGSTWQQVPSPSPGRAYYPHASLWGVSARSSTDAWAVGDDLTDIHDDDGTIALHWDGNSWSVVATPNPSTSNVLRAVAVTSGTNAWAVGFACPSGGDCGNPVEPITVPTSLIILHWNGLSWTAT
jgi:hypothetical protein